MGGVSGHTGKSPESLRKGIGDHFQYSAKRAKKRRVWLRKFLDILLRNPNDLLLYATVSV